MDIECIRFKPDWRTWGVEGKKEIEFSDWVPRKILYFATFIEELFNTKTKDEAFTMIENAGQFLKSLEGARLQGGPADNEFDSLFTVDGESTLRFGPDGLPLFDQSDDNNLRKMETTIKNGE
jgi:hypothetical protein